jgi:cardiolipin synthase
MGYWILLIVWLAGWTCIPHMLLLNKRPTATLAWLWAILLIPVFGAGLYLAIGSERVKRNRRSRRKGFRAKDHLASGRKGTAQSPAFYGALRESIENAKMDVHVESYIWRDDEVGREFLELLIATVKRGVAVRLLLDELGCYWLRNDYFKPLIEAGGEFSWCHTISPLRSRYSFNLRNHRKLQVIDGRIAFVGGMNFGREYLGRNPELGDWADVQLRMEGSVVEVLRQIFAEDWFFATGKEDPSETFPAEPDPVGNSFAQVLRGGPDEDDQPMLRADLSLIAAAKRRLWISTGYFVPGETMQTALQVAAAQGVDVRLLVSGRSEHPLLVQAGRSYYDALLRQGVQIFEYERGIEHSKYMVIDDLCTTIGSTNFDERSMRLNFELSVLVFNRELNEELAGIFTKTISESDPLDRETFSRRPFMRKLTESALRPLSPIL